MKQTVENMDRAISSKMGKYASTFALLVFCVLFIFVLPLFPSQVGWLNPLFLSIIIFIAASTISTKIMVVGLGAIIIELATKTTDFIYLHYLAELTTNLFFIGVIIFVILQILKRKQVTIYTLVDALNGYLLLGIMFVSLVSFVDFNQPGSFTGNRSMEFDLTYYTLITLTTTGYGDIVPNTTLGRSLSLLIAIAGQFYVAVIVAILVGKYSSTSSE
jgi:voltage-gated potassium channel